MIKVLVPTKPDDTHAIFAKLALEKHGHSADLWYTADFPSGQTNTFEINESDIQWTCKDKLEGSLLDHAYDVVWFRRPSKPILPNNVHHDDRENAKKEIHTLFQALWQVVLPNAVWINPVNAVTRVNAKLLQLKIAAGVGLKIPKTLISNDPDEIKSFIKTYEHNVVYKTLFPMSWLEEADVRLTYTHPITLNDLPSDKILQITPGIFQEKIEKSHELRVTYFGNQYIAVKIHSQAHEAACMDWRRAPTKELTLEQILLPAPLEECCRALMAKFGIVFGCFDFIVTNDNHYYFLEVNEQGQFLWIEDVNPEIKMLQAFVAFISSYDQSKQKVSPVSLQDFIHDMEIIKHKAMQCHKNPPIF